MKKRKTFFFFKFLWRRKISVFINVCIPSWDTEMTSDNYTSNISERIFRNNYLNTTKKAIINHDDVWEKVYILARQCSIIYHIVIRVVKCHDNFCFKIFYFYEKFQYINIILFFDFNYSIDYISAVYLRVSRLSFYTQCIMYVF